MSLNNWYVRSCLNKKTKEKTVTLCGDSDRFINVTVSDAQEESADCWSVKAGPSWYELHSEHIDRHFRPRLSQIKKLFGEIRHSVAFGLVLDEYIPDLHRIVHAFVYGYYF